MGSSPARTASIKFEVRSKKLEVESREVVRMMEKHYDAKAAEAKWYPLWEKNGYFHDDPDGRVPYSVVIPPPNVPPYSRFHSQTRSRNFSRPRS